MININVIKIKNKIAFAINGKKFTVRREFVNERKDYLNSIYTTTNTHDIELDLVEELVAYYYSHNVDYVISSDIEEYAWVADFND